MINDTGHSVLQHCNDLQPLVTVSFLILNAVFLPHLTTGVLPFPPPPAPVDTVGVTDLAQPQRHSNFSALSCTVLAVCGGCGWLSWRRSYKSVVLEGTGMLMRYFLRASNLGRRVALPAIWAKRCIKSSRVPAER